MELGVQSGGRHAGGRARSSVVSDKLALAALLLCLGKVELKNLLSLASCE